MEKFIVASSNPQFDDILETGNYSEVIQFIEDRKTSGFAITILDTEKYNEDTTKIQIINSDQLDVFLDDHYRKEIEKEDPEFFSIQEEVYEWEDVYISDDYTQGSDPYWPPC